MWNKIKKSLTRFCALTRRYGLTFALSSFCNTFLFRNAARFAKQKSRHCQRVMEYLQTNYGSQVSFQENGPWNPIQADSPIWVMWWQGREQMPELVDRSFQTILDNAGTHPVHLITQENYRNYAELPDHILKKTESGAITLTHLSDILRFYLLHRYGGFWMDATIYLSHPLDPEIYRLPLYTIRHGKDPWLCLGKWSGFFWASGPENPFCLYIYQMFCAYWEKEDCLMEYFLLDCVIRLLYEHVPQVQSRIDAIPCNNAQLFLLEEALNITEPISPTDGTYIFKMSYKKPHTARTNMGALTNYGRLLSGESPLALPHN